MDGLKQRIKFWLGGFMLPIRSGPLRGMRWTVASGSKFLRGTYEPESTAALLEHVSPGDVVFDVGAHVGYLTAVASQAVGPGGRVIAFEPRPMNYLTLLRHTRANELTNVTTVQKGVAHEAGVRRFDVSTGSGTGRMSDEGALEITTVSLDEEVEAGRLPVPGFVKIDVEGAEAEVLEGMKTIVEQHRPTLLVSTHGEEAHRAVQAFLERAGYSVARIDRNDRPFDAELLARPDD